MSQNVSAAIETSPANPDDKPLYIFCICMCLHVTLMGVVMYHKALP